METHAWQAATRSAALSPEGHDAALLSPSAGAKKAIFHRRNDSEARSSDLCGLRMRDVWMAAGDACIRLGVATGDGEVLQAVHRRALQDGWIGVGGRHT